MNELQRWAQSNEYSFEELAQKMGYKSPRYVEQLIRGWEPITNSFIGRFMRAFPKAGIRFFLPSMSEKSDIMSSETNGILAGDGAQ